MLKFIGSVAASNFKRLGSPFKVSWAVTYRCNLRCKMCNIWDKKDHPPEVNADEIGALFSRPHHVHWLGITGGEPFLRTDLIDIVDAALTPSKTLNALHFATNGSYTDRVENLVHTLKKRHKKLKIVFTVSIDGPEALHNHIRGIDGTWGRALATFKMLKKIPNVKPQFGFTLSHNNLDKFERTFLALGDVYPALTFDDMTVNVFQRSNFYYENHAMPELDPARLTREIQKILAMDKDRLSLNNFLRRKYLKLYLQFLKTRKSPVKCQSFASTCFLDPYGNLFPCAVYNRKLLNIKETVLSLNEIWQLKEALRIHTECARNKCPSCWSPCDAYSAMGGSIIPTVFK